MACFENACRKPCAADLDCGLTGECASGHCVVQCDADADCPAYSDGGCAGGAVCNNGLCNYPGACMPPLVCHAGSCTDACTNYQDCAPDEVCTDGACVPVDAPDCDENSDCTGLAADAACWEGSCHAACTTADDCGWDQTCELGYCFGSTSCVSDTECVADAPCVASQGRCTGGACEYDWAATNSGCDDGDPCTAGEQCSAEHACSGGAPNVGAACATGVCVDNGGSPACSSDHCYIDGVLVDAGAADPTNPCAACDPADATDWTYEPEQTACDSDGNGSDDGYCLASSTGANGRICRTDVCLIDGGVVPDGSTHPSNACAACDAATSSSAWTFSPQNDPCDADSDTNNDGLCLPPDSGTDPVVCRQDQCLIAATLYDSGDPNPANACELCDPSRGFAYLTDWYNPVGRECPLGCAPQPIPHCVQPSNWGYWEGTTQHADGLTLEWIEADAGGNFDLTVASGTVTIDTDVPSVTVDAGPPLALSEGVDTLLVAQDSFHQGTNATPGVSGALPELVAIKFTSIDITSAQVTCTGSRPLALASAGNVRLGGTWEVACGVSSAGSGTNATDSLVSRYAIRGGGGAGYFEAGGYSGAPTDNTSGGIAFGRAALQPLLGGSAGGSGFGSKAYDTSALGDNLSTVGCWFFAAEAACPSPSSSTFDTWVSGTWNATVIPARPSGGSGGGALQVVSLGTLAVTGALDASGSAGESLEGCSNASVDYTGNQLLDWRSYPVKYNCSSCSDGAISSRWWRNWFVQTGGGGGSGGAVLLEGATVEVNPAARVIATGGGGGAGCYMNGYIGTPAGGTYPADLGAYLLARAPTAPGDGQHPAAVDNYQNMSGGEGGPPESGSAAAPYGSANPTNEIGIVGEVTIDGSQNVAWGGGGGSTGRIRINTPAGTVTCAGDCSAVFVPAASPACESASAAQICPFPGSTVHYGN